MYIQTLIENPTIRITVGYFVAASVWILLSDSALIGLGVDVALLSALGTLKGMFFVLFTSVLLYLHVRYELRSAIKSRRR